MKLTITLFNDLGFIQSTHFFIILPIVFSIFASLVAYYGKVKFNSWLNLITLVSMVFILGYSVRFITLIYGYNHFDIPIYNMSLSLIYSFIVYILFLLGTLIGFNINTYSKIRIEKTNNFETRLLISLNAMLTSASFLVLLISMGGWDNLVNSFSNKSVAFSGMGIYFVLLSAFSVVLALLISIKSITFNLKTYLFIFFSFLPLLATGGRALLVLVFFSFVLLYEFKSKKFKLRNLILFSVIGLIFYLSYFTYFRVYNLTGSWEYLFDNATQLYYNTLVNGALSFIDGLNVIMYYVPETVNYLGGYSLFSGLIIFIPSFLFPNKPENSAFLYNEIFNSNQYLRGTGQNPSFIGEVYWNLGPINTLLIFLMIGVFFGILYKKSISVDQTSNYLSVIIIIFMVPISLFVIKSGLSSGTPYRILIPLVINLFLLFILKKFKVMKNV